MIYHFYIRRPVVPRSRCGYSVLDPARTCPCPMLFDPRIVRMFAKAASVALVWLLGASVSEGAPGFRRVDRERVCDAQTPSVRKLPRHPKSFGGPVARTRRARGGLSFD